MLAKYALLAPANDNLKISYLPYAIKCDDCKATIRRTANIQESYQGGACDRCKAQQNVKRFEVGHTYMMRSPGDHNCVWAYRVVARTPKQVTLSGHGKTIRRGVKVYSGIEMCMPLGSYSMSPCLTAEKEVK